MYEFFNPSPVLKKKDEYNASAPGAMTGEDYIITIISSFFAQSGICAALMEHCQKRLLTNSY
jgi:hypothetical protein